MSTVQRIRVSAALKKKNYPHLGARAHVIYNAMLLNAVEFPNALPTLATLLVLVTSFDVAQQAAEGKIPGAAATRNAKALQLITGLESEETYVQGLCDASPEQAMELIAFAGMVAMTPPSHPKSIIGAALVPGALGTVVVSAYAKQLLAGSHKRPTFNWQGSPDCKTINNLPSTPHATMLVTNLPLLANAYFRVNVTLGKVTGEWSQWVMIFVH
jgi:hypothetical protein